MSDIIITPQDRAKYGDKSEHDLLIITATRQDSIIDQVKSVTKQVKEQNGRVFKLHDKINALPCGVHTERIDNLEGSKAVAVSRIEKIKVGIICSSVTAVVVWLTTILPIP